MKPNRPVYIFLVLALGYLVVAGVFANRMIKDTESSIDKRYKVAEILNFEERILSAKEWIFTADEWAKKKRTSVAMLHESEKDYESAQSASAYLIMASIGFLLVSFLVYFGTQQFLKVISLSLVCGSLVFLYVGIYTPMLELGAFNEDLVVPLELKGSDIEIVHSIPIDWVREWFLEQEIDLSRTFEGRMYYYYQSKTIAQLIGLLFRDKNMVVGISILCFSIIIPLLKLLLTVAILFIPRLQRVKWLTVSIAFIGKYSMADVFVAAMFLGFLSFQNMNTGIETEANTMMGLYYFFTYVLMSIVSTFLMIQIIKHPVSMEVIIGNREWK